MHKVYKLMGHCIYSLLSTSTVSNCTPQSFQMLSSHCPKIGTPSLLVNILSKGEN